ncbi:hypothetical protein [Micromonospora sp. ATA51]|nr:hypothetical protein [Micromonospora sp. ATA51]MBM0229943.1 hypothetical protein [Micromonospora sp. ATA51]
MAIDARLVRDGLVDVEAFAAAAEVGAVGVCDGCAGCSTARRPRAAAWCG